MVNGWLDTRELRRGGLCGSCRFIVEEAGCDRCQGARLFRWRQIGLPGAMVRVLGGGRARITALGTALAATQLGTIAVVLTHLGHAGQWFWLMNLSSVSFNLETRRAHKKRARYCQDLGPILADPTRGSSQVEGVILDGGSSRDESVVTAWQVTDGAGLLVRHARTAGLLVLLDDGRRVRVPAGRARVTAAEPFWSMLETQQFAKTKHPLRLELARATVGTKVALAADLVPLSEPGGGYRDAPGPTHATRGVATLELLQ